MTSTRLKFELIDAAAARRTALAPAVSKVIAPPDPRSIRQLAEGLDFVLEELLAAEAQRDRVAGERDEVASERAALATQRDLLLEQREQIEAQRGQIQTQRDALELQRDELASQRDLVQAQIEEIQSQLAGVEQGYTEARAQIDRMAEDRVRELAERNAERDAFAAQLEAERTAFQARIEADRIAFEARLEQERAAFQSERQTERANHDSACASLHENFQAEYQVLSARYQTEQEERRGISDAALAAVREEADQWRAQAERAREEYLQLSAALQAAEEQTKDLQQARRTLETVLAEQQRALVLSMELMSRLEGEVRNLRTRVDVLTAEVIAESRKVPAEAAAQIAELQAAKLQAESAATDLLSSTEVLETRARHLETMILDLSTSHATELAKREAEVVKRSAQVARLQNELDDADRNLQAAPPPEAALRSIENQRDQARQELATFKSDIEILTADVKTKEGLITTLEAALDQQQAVLRSLEERFNEYASRLQGICDTSPEENDERADSGDGKMKRLVTWFQSAFSPARIAAPVAEAPDYESGENAQKGLNDDTTELTTAAAGVGHGTLGGRAAGIKG